MARLQDALRGSGYFAAYCDAPVGYRVIVEQTNSGPKPEDGAPYTCKVEHGVALPEGTFTNSDPRAVLEYLRSLNLSGFDPEADAWQPATGGTYVQSAEWLVDAPVRGVVPEDSALGAHAEEPLA